MDPWMERLAVRQHAEVLCAEAQGLVEHSAALQAQSRAFLRRLHARSLAQLSGQAHLTQDARGQSDT